MTWKPTATLQSLKDRARILELTRDFFKARGVLEVDIPVLGLAPVTDPFLEALSTQTKAFPGKTFYLQTSPEYYQKRLIAAHHISCYFLGKCFRDDEYGRHHSPEFSMLEWYHLGFDDQRLMNEVADLLQTLGSGMPERLSYQEAFLQFLHVDPQRASLADLQNTVKTYRGEMDRDTALQLLMTEVIEPELAKREVPVFLYDFPASQAALAKIKTLPDGSQVAARFEVYWGGMELGNGYHELVDVQEQRLRFNHDLQKRQNLNLPAVPIDQNLLLALEQGLPECAGIAMGFDRLVMVLLQKKHLAEVQPFFEF